VSKSITRDIFPYRGTSFPLEGEIFSPVGENTRRYAFGGLQVSKKKWVG